MEIDSQTGLVLEGGGMRAIFTVGVSDYFMDHDIWFPSTIGASAGASNGISYASRQRGRSTSRYMTVSTARSGSIRRNCSNETCGILIPTLC